MAKPESPAANKAICPTFARALDAELRSDTVIRGRSGLEHAVQAIAVDDRNGMTAGLCILHSERSKRHQLDSRPEMTPQRFPHFDAGSGKSGRSIANTLQEKNMLLHCG